MMASARNKNLLNKDYQYCDLLGNDLLKECMGNYTNEELKHLKEEDWAIMELKQELKHKLGSEKNKLNSGLQPSSASKVRFCYLILLSDLNIKQVVLLQRPNTCYYHTANFRYILGDPTQKSAENEQNHPCKQVHHFHAKMKEAFP